MLDVAIQKDLEISIHQQLVTQISLQIASGALPAGTRLPSVRVLSKRLSIHYNTCLAVYKELGELGLVEIKKGSGVRVAAFEAAFDAPRADRALEGKELHHMAEYFVRIVKAKGYSSQEVEAALRLAWRETEAWPRRVVLVDAHADIIPLFRAELEERLQRPVEGLTLDEVTPREAERRDTRYIVSRYHYKPLVEKLGNAENVLIFDVGGGTSELELIKTLPAGALVVIVSQCETVLRMGESVVGGFRGSDLLVRTIHTSEGPEEMENAFRYAQLIIGDVLCAKEAPRPQGKPFKTLRVIPDSELEKLAEALLSFKEEVETNAAPSR